MRGGEPVLWGEHLAPGWLPPRHPRVSDRGLGLLSQLAGLVLCDDGLCPVLGSAGDPVPWGGQ